MASTPNGAVPSPDGKLLATSARGPSSAHPIDAVDKRVIGNTPNPSAGPTTNRDRLPSGSLVGREPHDPTFTRNRRELWAMLRGKSRIEIRDIERALRQLQSASASAIRQFLPTINGSAQVWFNQQGTLAFWPAQQVAKVDVICVNTRPDGHSRPEHFRRQRIGQYSRVRAAVLVSLAPPKSAFSSTNRAKPTAPDRAF